MIKQESYKTYMILMISSDGIQNNVSFYFCSLPIVILSGFQDTAISLYCPCMTWGDCKYDPRETLQEI